MRTAHSPKSPPLLKQYVDERLGGERRPMLCDLSDALGLTYMPQYVLKDEQITALVKGAATRTGDNSVNDKPGDKPILGPYGVQS
jgi:hypothetical protein